MVPSVLQDRSPWLPQGQYVLTPGPENLVSRSGDRGERDITAPAQVPPARQQCPNTLPARGGTPPASAAGADPAQTLHRSLIWGHF